MAAPPSSFLFKIDRIVEAEDAPPAVYTITGDYKPPIYAQHCVSLDSTGWCRWSENQVSLIAGPLPAASYCYATSMFYDETTSRFLFHPADCRIMNVSDVEHQEGERWGWQCLKFRHLDLGSNHSVLAVDGEHPALSGQPGSFSPTLLPYSYRSQQVPMPCNLSGHLSLLFALTAFSCNPQFMLSAIRLRLNFPARRWDDIPEINWGNGRQVCSFAHSAYKS